MEELEVLRVKTVYDRLQHHGFERLEGARLIYNTKPLKYMGKVPPHQLEIAKKLFDKELAIISMAIAIHKALPHHVTPAKAEEIIDALLKDPHKHYNTIKKLRTLAQLVSMKILPVVFRKYETREPVEILEATVREINEMRNSIVKRRILDVEKHITSKFSLEDKIKASKYKYRLWP